MINDKQAIRRSRLKLILLFSIFLLPAIAAYVVYKHPQWQPKGGSNHGDLMKPPVRLKPFTLLTQTNKPYDLHMLRGKWSLIYIGGSHCDKACEVTLIKARDARWAQGTAGTRVKYYYVLTSDKFTDDVAKLHKKFPALTILHGNAKQRAALIQQFRVSPNQQLGRDNQLYLVDPTGLFILHYPYGFKHIGLIEDLRHLLKWSQIG